MTFMFFFYAVCAPFVLGVLAVNDPRWDMQRAGQVMLAVAAHNIGYARGVRDGNPLQGISAWLRT